MFFCSADLCVVLEGLSLCAGILLCVCFSWDGIFPAAYLIMHVVYVEVFCGSVIVQYAGMFWKCTHSL